MHRQQGGDPEVLFAERFAALVDDSGLSIREIATRAQVGRSTIDGWKHRKALPQDAGSLIRVVAAAGGNAARPGTTQNWRALLSRAKEARDARSYPARAPAGRRSAITAERSAASAESAERSASVQAEAARAQAAAEKERLAIERERFHRELTPVLEGSVRRRPAWRGGRTDHILEVRVSKGPPLMSLVLHLPAGAPVGRSAPSLMANDLGYPEVGSPMIKPGHPATWDVVVSPDPPTSFTATADCRGDYGEQWLDVEVLVKLEDG